MARVRKVEIRNFRGIKELTWLPKPGVNCLIECKYLSDRTQLDYARSFIGLAKDLTAKHEFFVTSTSSTSVQRLLHEQKLKWARDIRPLNADLSSELRSAFRNVFTGYRAGKVGKL